ncbi:glycosyltransferase [Nocardia sp. NPDC051756]|uniref:glycosyltransferase n=1 Tax=Nocardia sp. NPDC051756 TaxID=3154751 RepID=UPI00342C8EE2
MLVSVLTATFNRRATFLPQCLDNVRHQIGDGFDYEHIVIDDCSTDGTWDYLQQVARADPRVKPIRTRATRMMAHAQNCGLDVATGDLVVPLDDDDLLLPRSLQLHTEFMRDHPDIDWSFGHTLRIDADNRLLDSAWENETKYAATEYSDDPAEFFTILLAANRVLGNTVVLRRSALVEVGGWDEEVVCQDWALWLRLTHAGKRHARRRDYLACRRVHPHQLTTIHQVDGTYDRDQQYFWELYGHR